MKWMALPVIAAAFLSPAGLASPPIVDEEFLEYLGSLEDSDDNWTVVAGDKAAQQQRTTAKTTSTSQPTQTATRPAPTSPPAQVAKPEPKS